MNEHLTRITPVQLRGAGAIEPPEEERGLVRVRIRTRGNLDRALRIRDPIPLVELVEALRRDVGGLPLTFVAVADDDSPSSPAIAFLQQLGGDPLDARWLATRKHPDGTSSAPATVLDLERSDRDRYIFHNLVADLLFIAGTGKSDPEAMASFAHRAPIVVVPHDGVALDSFGPAAAAADIAVLTWRADTGEIDAPTPDKLWPSLFPRRDRESDDEWREVLTRRLSEIAAQLTVREDRRIRFRDILAEAAQTYPEATAPDGLVPLADALSWPRWAVETLPKRYVRRQLDDGLVRAFVWNVLLECIAGPVRDVQTKLCGGAIFDVRVTEDLAAVLEELDRAIEDFVAAMPHAGDQVFYTAVACAVEQVASRPDTQPAHAARMRSVSRKLGSWRT